MVESPKDPPNVEFGVAFPQTTVVREKTETTTTATATAITPDIQSTACSNVQEPIDVNTPRDTANIFYAYEVADASAEPIAATVECAEQQDEVDHCDSGRTPTDGPTNDPTQSDS